MFKFSVFVFVLSIFLCNCIYGQESAYFFNLQWGNETIEIDEAHVGDRVIIKFETRNVPDNEIINIEIWEKTDNQLMDFINGVIGIVKNEIVELEWIIEFDQNNENTNYGREIREIGYAIIDYVFLIKYNNITVSSELLAILAWADRLIVDSKTDEPLRNRDFVVMGPDGKFIIGKTDDEGRAVIKNLRKIGRYTFIM